MELSDMAIEIERFLAVEGFNAKEMSVSELLEELYNRALEDF